MTLFGNYNNSKFFTQELKNKITSSTKIQDLLPSIYAVFSNESRAVSKIQEILLQEIGRNSKQNITVLTLRIGILKNI